MLKRTLALILGLLMLAGTALADLPDFASMSFEDLNAMKQALDEEYFARPEAEGRNLGTDEYVVGRDILPGTYYVSMVFPADETDRINVCIYNSIDELKAEKNPQYHDHPNQSFQLKLGGSPQMLSLNDGEVICVEWGSMFIKTSEYNPEDYYKYTPPEGTVVPKGNYTIGAEIPAGTYILYPATVSSGAYRVNDEFGDRFHVYNEVQSGVVTLNEGDSFQVNDAVSMKRQAAFNFD